MSISNRKLKEGDYTVKYESKFQTFLGKVYCFLKGHQEVILKDRKYCICCWKEME